MIMATKASMTFLRADFTRSCREASVTLANYAATFAI